MKTTYKRGLLLNPADNVVNALDDMLPGDAIQLNLGAEILTINVEERIPFGFKIAARDISIETPIIKYGQQIGLANRDIRKGTLVHVHNMSGARGRGDLSKEM
jgi:hypothetical protein